ncbi:MAG: twin-arginine translocase subunit TatC [Deltaproteobacteria bacterium]
MESRFAGVLEEIDKARRGVAIYAAVVLALTAVSYVYAGRLLTRMAALLNRRLVAYDPSEGFFATLSIALYCGIALSLPVGAGLLWNGVVAARRPEWKRWGILVILVATLLFLAGAFLGYRVLLPAGIGFLAGFENERFRALISARKFISFCGTILLAIGFSFEAPLVSYFLARFGWLRPAFFRNKWRHAVLICTVVAAVITPTPDVYNLTLMTIPLLALFFVSFVVVWAVDRGRNRPPTP